MISKQKRNFLKFFVTCFWALSLYTLLYEHANWSTLDLKEKIWVRQLYWVVFGTSGTMVYFYC